MGGTHMSRMAIKKGWLIFMVALLAILPATALAYLDGVTGAALTPTFNLVAKDGRIMMGDGTTAYSWGYATYDPLMIGCLPQGCAQYPGPTLIVNQGDFVTVNLVNKIPTLKGNTPVNVSIVFPGQNVTATGGLPGLITREAPPDGATVVTYTFTASNPGTYSYFSGTRPELEVEMGLVGTLVVRPTLGPNCVLPATQAIFAFPPDYPFSPSPSIDPTVAFAPIPATLPVAGVQTPTLSASRGFAYCAIDAYYDHEYLHFITDLDPAIHLKVERGQMAQIDNTDRHPTAWFINGRNFPDTQADAYVPWLPDQPYTALPLVHPGEVFLIRFVGGGRNLHPMHAHGQNHNVIARDGRLLQSGAGARVDLPISDYTTTVVPGETADAIWGSWTGARLNWDIYGHANYVDANGVTEAACDPLTTPLAPGEYIGDHCKPFPVAFPAPTKMTYGVMWGGTPFIGVPGNIPAIDPNTGAYHTNLNTMAAQTFMFHSHNEREITTNNIFIGGAAIMTMVMPWTDMDGNLIIIP
jgi:FtsP/CotA-like multicopper oxidase with cupredoxin domain